MKKVVLYTLIVVALIVTTGAIKFNSNQQHYYLLEEDGTLTSGQREFTFDEIEWVKSLEREWPEMPYIDGKLVVCRIGDDKCPMYFYHPFTASNRTDFDHNSATLPMTEFDSYGFHVDGKVESQLFQAVVKVPREYGGVGSVERGLIEGSITIPAHENPMVAVAWLQSLDTMYPIEERKVEVRNRTGDEFLKIFGTSPVTQDQELEK